MAPLLVALALCASFAGLVAQPGHRILAVRNRFYLEDLATGVRRPFDMWVTRLANACMSKRMTDRVIACLDDYRRYGVNTLAVSIQGGTLGWNTNKQYPRAYLADGSLDPASPVYPNLARLLAACDRRGMVLMIEYWHPRRDEEVPDDARALQTTRLVTRWLKGLGHRNYALDIVNEFGHGAYTVPGNPTRKRPLFTTLTGALQLLAAVRDEDPKVLVGMSPPSRLFFPAGYLDDPVRGRRWLEADIIYGHNEFADPSRPASYHLGSVPTDWTAKPYVNNEFSAQLRYEKTPRPDPRRGGMSYGHWDAATVQGYVADLLRVRRFGYGNVFSHRQQYTDVGLSEPIPEVGPAGTQPESTPGSGEPSMHWLLAQVANLAKREPAGLRLDFAAGAGGFETDLAGTWTGGGGALRQTDPQAPLAWARLAAVEGDFEVEVDVALQGAPAPGAAAGLQVGGPGPEGPGYRLRLLPGALVLDDPGGTLATARVNLAGAAQGRLLLRAAGGRLQAGWNGTVLVDVAAPPPPPKRNLLLLTERAVARFSNLRLTARAETDFRRGVTGLWQPATPSAWRLTTLAGKAVWEAQVPPGGREALLVDRILPDVALAVRADLTATQGVELILRIASPRVPTLAGYRFLLGADGTYRLEARGHAGRVRALGSGRLAGFQGQASILFTADGPRVRAQVNGTLLVDLTENVADPAAGGLAVVALPGTLRLERLLFAVTPNRAPVARFVRPPGQPLPAGFAVEFSDPDGLADLRTFRLLLDVGGGFLDVTWVLYPQLGLFRAYATPDGRGLGFRLALPLPLGAVPWTLRAEARDGAGELARVDLRLGP